MKVKDIIKKQTTIIAIAVVLVTIAAISVSYAIFFDIQAGDTQTITAGTLKLTLTNLSALNITEPVSTEEGLKTTHSVSYTIENGGNLPAKYTLYICTGSTSSDLTGSIFFSTSGGTASSTDYALNTKTSVSAESIQDTEHPLSGTCYQIETGTIETNTSNKVTQSKNLNVWVDDSTLSDDITAATVDLTLAIVSEVYEENAGPSAG